jgi:membrane associated rhomboid family serine protease
MTVSHTTTPGPAASRAAVTWALAALTGVCYLLQALSGQSLLDIPVDVLQSMGGNLAMLSLTGDGWRLLSNVFLHAGLLHLAMNMYMLALAGPLAEREYGRAGMLCVYLLGGAWASYASAFWNARHMFQETLASMMGLAPPLRLIVSVGASGALMALCGALLAAWAFAVKRDDSMPPASRTAGVIAQIVAINLVLGFFTKGVDQAAHVGGVIAGFVFGAAAGALVSHPRTRAHWLRLAGTAAAGVAVLAAVLHFSPWQDLRELRQDYDEEIAAEKQALADRINAQRVAAYRKNGEMAAQKANSSAGKALLASLPPPVSKEQAMGRVFELPRQLHRSVRMRLTEDEKTIELIDYDGVTRLVDLETGQMTLTDTAPETLKQLDGDYQVLARAPGTGQILKKESSEALELVDPASGETLKTWMSCDVPYIGQSYSVEAAVIDGQGRILLASLGSMQAVRVTDLETGMDIALLPTYGQAGNAAFSKDGKRLYTVNEKSRYMALQIFDIGKRLAGEFGKDNNITAPVICVWPENLP